MARLLELARGFGDWNESPREVTRTIPTSESIGESGWLIRFFDSSFFCEWIAVSYLYKHPHSGVRDYLCNRMYTLPLPGIESYLFQICYMTIHKPSPSLDKFVIDVCSKSLKIALKVHWFLMAELEDVDDNEGISRIQEKCQLAATLMGEWPPLIKPQTNFLSLSSSSNNNSSNGSPAGKNQMLNRLLSSKQKLLSLTSSPPSNRLLSRSFSFSPSSGNSKVQDDAGKVLGSPEENKMIFKKLIPGNRVRDALMFRKSIDKEEEESEKDFGFFKRLMRDSKDEDMRKSVDKDRDTEEGPEKESRFFKKMLRDGRDEDTKKSLDGCKDEEEHDKDGGFFRRLLSHSRDEELRKSMDRNEEDPDRDGFFRRFLSGKDEDEDASSSSEGFFKRLFRDNKNVSDEKLLIKSEDNEKEGLFKKFFKDKFEDKKDGIDKNDELEKMTKGSEEEGEGFFKKFFKEKTDDRKFILDQNDEDRNRESNGVGEESSDLSLFRRLFRIRAEDTKILTVHDNGYNSNLLESSPGTESFFRKLFKDRDHSVEDSELCGSKNNKMIYFRKLVSPCGYVLMKS